MNNPERMTQLKELFKNKFGTEVTTIEPIPPSGSHRLYYRLKDDKGNTGIGTYNYHVAENNSYFYFAELLRKHGIHVAEVYGVSKDHKHYLQQDLGNQSLFDLLQEKGHTAEVKGWYKKALEQLAKYQWVAGQAVDFDQCYGTKKFDEGAIASDLLYFKYYFADLQEVAYNKDQVHDDIKRWSKELGGVQPQMLMFRDFQSRNIFIHEGKVWFIDFQGAMQGAPQYDVASLLWQAKAQLPESWKSELLNSYLASLAALSVRVDEIYFRKVYNQFVLLRILQTLGAYGFRGLIERKPHFVTSISPALHQMESFLEQQPALPAYSDLRKLLEQVAHDDVKQRYASKPKPKATKLEVEVCSFSYKNGYPKDETSHGGGYVFDCRGLLNPGRQDAYKKLSGQDLAVQHYLDAETEMPAFIEHIKKLVSISVEEYISRDFDRLSIAFGCTGGQHRSVYAAEQMAAFLKQQFGLKVQLQHLNKDNWVR